MKETSGGIGRSFLPAAGAIAFAAACLAVDGARAANFIVVPTDLQFDATFVGETTVIEVTVMNVSAVPRTPSYAGGAPFDGMNFGGSQACVGVTLPPGGSCPFYYAFHPASSGPKSTYTNVTIDQELFAFTMEGNGRFPLTVGPLLLDFGKVAVGGERDLAVIVANVSGVAQSPDYAGGAPFDTVNFGGWQVCVGVTLPPGGRCLFTYRFHPDSPGVKVSSTTVAVDGRNFGIHMVGIGDEETIFANGFD